MKLFPFMDHVFPFAETRENSLKNVDDSIQNILCALRQHMEMDVAFVSKFADGKRFYQYVDASDAGREIEVGGFDPLEDSYCQRVIDGRLPELIRDAADCTAAAELTITVALKIGAHLSVPLKLSDGRIYGTFCCFSHAPKPSLNERDLSIVSAFASLAAREIECDISANEKRLKLRARIISTLQQNKLSTVYQPIFDLNQHSIIGFEALTRIASEPSRPPDIWFTEAAQVNLGIDLETAAIQSAVRGLEHFPEHVYISINASPDVILSGRVEKIFQNVPLKRVVLEITEHVQIESYDALNIALQSLRTGGVRVAVDDAGAGYASFRHILKLSPDIIKLDISLTRDIDSDRVRRALALALIRFSEETGSLIVAEGIETVYELHTLLRLGASMAQGYLLGRPMSADKGLDALRRQNNS